MGLPTPLAQGSLRTHAYVANPFRPSDFAFFATDADARAYARGMSQGDLEDGDLGVWVACGVETPERGFWMYRGGAAYSEVEAFEDGWDDGSLSER